MNRACYREERYRNVCTEIETLESTYTPNELNEDPDLACYYEEMKTLRDQIEIEWED